MDMHILEVLPAHIGQIKASEQRSFDRQEALQDALRVVHSVDADPHIRGFYPMRSQKR